MRECENARMLECENENNAGCFCHNAGINAVQPSTLMQEYWNH